MNGRGPGDTVDLAAGGGTVRVEAAMRSITPLERVWLVQDGREIAEVPLADDRRSAVLSQDIAVESSGWIHLRAEGSPDKRYPLDAAYAQAFTNPVWLLVGDAPIRDRAAAEHALDWIDRLEAMARGTAGWRSETAVARVVARFDEARAAYRRLRSEAAG